MLILSATSQLYQKRSRQMQQMTSKELYCSRFRKPVAYCRKCSSSSPTLLHWKMRCFHKILKTVFWVCTQLKVCRASTHLNSTLQLLYHVPFVTVWYLLCKNFSYWHKQFSKQGIFCKPSLLVSRRIGKHAKESLSVSCSPFIPKVFAWSRANYSNCLPLPLSLPLSYSSNIASAKS